MVSDEFERYQEDFEAKLHAADRRMLVEMVCCIAFVCVMIVLTCGGIALIVRWFARG